MSKNIYPEYIFDDYLISPLNGQKIKSFNQNHFKKFGLTWQSFQDLYPGFPYRCPSLGKKNSLNFKKNTASDRMQKRKQEYLLDPSKCINCGISLPYKIRKNKFCSSSCAAKSNNSKRSKETINKQRETLKNNFFPYTAIRQCSKCGKFHTKIHAKFCSSACKPVRGKDKNSRGGRPKLKWPFTKVKPCAHCGKYMANIRLTYCESCSPNIRHYRSRAAFKFNVYDYPDKFNLSLIDRHGWFSPNGYKRRNKTPNLNGISRDHLYSVADGFKNDVDPKVLAHPANCQLILHNGPNGNSSKNSKSSISLQELLKRIDAWEK